MSNFFIVVSFLVVAQYVENTSGLSVNIGKDIFIPQPQYENVQECYAEWNNILYMLYPVSNLTNAKIRDENYSCTFSLMGVNFNHAGEWKIISVNKNPAGEIEQKQNLIKIEVDQLQKSQPTDHFVVEKGNYAIAYFLDYFDNITECYAIYEEFHSGVKYFLSDHGNGTQAELELYGKCGIRMPIKDQKFVGSWSLVQSSGPYKRKKVHFLVSAFRSDKDSQGDQIWKRGTKNSVVWGMQESDAIYCYVELPDGEVVELFPPTCTYEIEVVSDIHAGVWKWYYTVSNSMKTINHKTNVTIIDPEKIKVSVIKGEHNNFHMLCQTYQNFDFCFFKSPNGTLIHSIPGIGNNKYEFYREENKEGNKLVVGQCGLTIIEPDMNDYGLWKCSIRLEKRSPVFIHAYLDTASLIKKNLDSSQISANDIHVKKLDNFTVMCRARRKLEYCRFQSPSGHNFFVSKDTRNYNGYSPYFGHGLLFDTCGAIIQNASKAYVGNWSCQLGVADGLELKSTFTVVVEDSYIIPMLKTIKLPQNKPIMAIRLLPGLKSTIQYCRWIHPNGYELHREDRLHYVFKQNATSCMLNLQHASNEDFGTWHCYARLNTDPNEEFYTTIDLMSEFFEKNLEKTKSTLITFNVIAIFLTLLIVICVVICGVFFYKKQKKIKINSPTYYHEYNPSRENPIIVKTKSDVS